MQHTALRGIIGQHVQMLWGYPGARESAALHECAIWAELYTLLFQNVGRTKISGKWLKLLF